MGRGIQCGWFGEGLTDCDGIQYGWFGEGLTDCDGIQYGWFGEGLTYCDGIHLNGLRKTTKDGHSARCWPAPSSA